MEYIKGHLTLRGTIIGSIGCIVITAASVYTALKLGALPWPIVFAAIISLFFLKAIGKGKVSLNEANVTHTIMSAGAMVAGGLAFTIPAAWMLGYASEVSVFDMLVIALAGVILGLVCTALLRRHFIEEANLEYPIGEAAAQTLIAGNSGGKTGVKLFGAMGFAGIYTALRDLAGVIPSMFLSNITIPGVSFGIYNSPMLLAVGFLVGTGAVVVWFVGALVANFGIIVGGSAAGLWDVTTAQGIVSSLGMGIMMGAGFGVIFKDIIPKAIKMIKSSSSGEETNSKQLKAVEKNTNNKKPSFYKLTAGMFGIAVAAVALLVCFVLGLGIIPTLIVVVLAFVATAMSAQSVGQTGIDPMEIFGLIVLLAVAAASDIVQVKLFYVAAIVAVACGLAGDVMNDFHAGYRLGTSPQAQWIGQAIGSVLGSFVSVAVMVLLLGAYGPDAFGPQSLFVSAQASVVATFVSGIPSISSLVVGLVLGVVLYFVKLPSMMLGLGIYLPFYMSFSAFLGAVAKLIYDFVCKWIERRRHDESAEKSCENDSASEAVVSKEQEETGLVVASGLLGGESIVGVIAALIVVILGAAA